MINDDKYVFPRVSSVAFVYFAPGRPSPRRAWSNRPAPGASWLTDLQVSCRHRPVGLCSAIVGDGIALLLEIELLDGANGASKVLLQGFGPVDQP